jgi:hypothetical protein
MVERLHLAAVRIRDLDGCGLAADSTLDSLGTSVDYYGLPAKKPMDATSAEHFSP